MGRFGAPFFVCGGPVTRCLGRHYLNVELA
jgi:hypothetical protein